MRKTFSLAGILLFLVICRPAGAQTIVLRAAGDVMMHNTQLSNGYRPATHTYSFISWFAPIRDLIQEADLSFCNLETPMAGAGARYTGYPQFNAPDEIAMAVKWAGFKVVTTANNHSMDRRTAGVIRTVHVLDHLGLIHTGTFDSPERRNTPVVVDVKGIKIGILAYTFGTNGLPVPESYLVNRIDPRLVARDAAAARAAGAEIVVADVHWGVEYTRHPTAEQQSQAKQIVAAGVDIIFGSHPHVLEPIAWVTASNGRRGLVFYSMGNFVSAQHGEHKDEGIIAHVEISRTGPGAFRFERVGYIPTYVDRYYHIFAVQRALHTDPALSGPLNAAWQSTVALLNNQAAAITVYPVQ